MSEPTTTAKLDEYLDGAIGLAVQAFYESLAGSFPRAVSGDMSPEDADHFDTAATVAAKAWIRANAYSAR